jgi:sialic acid synthase SpsE
MVKVIAEIAQGYEGNYKQAELLLRAAIKAGADAIKYQLVIADEFCTQDYIHYQLFRSLEMDEEQWGNLVNIAAAEGREIHFDVFGHGSLSLATSVNADAIKVHATDMGNIGLLESVAESRVNAVCLGVGGAFLPEIERAVSIFEGKELCLMAGFQGYPTREEDNQIGRLNFLNRHFSDAENVSLGFADHSPPDTALSYAIPAVAIGAGATTLEKHITLGRVLELEDFESALNPDQFAQFTHCIRKCGTVLGRTDEAASDLGMSQPELEYRQKTRKHAVACKALKIGAEITMHDIALKRTSATEAFTDVELLYGRKLIQGIQKNQPFQEYHFER